MNILVVEEKGQLTEFEDGLKRAGHQVRVSVLAAAGAAIGKDKPDITVVVCADPARALPPLVTVLRAPDDAAYRSVLAVLAKDTPAVRSAAYEAGADQVTTLAATPAELVDQVRSTERIVRLERRLRERVLELEAALRRLALQAAVRGQTVASPNSGANRGSIRFLLTHAWTGVDDTLRLMCSEYLQQPYAQVIGAMTLAPGCRGATISLTDVENELVLDLSFYIPKDSAVAIATAFTGDASLVDEEVINDVILELANSGMGAVRAAFLSEEFRFAASTPKAVVSTALEKMVEGVEAKRLITFRHAAATLHAVLTVRHQGRVKVFGALLREGMVIMSDVKNDAGVLLVRAGTRLTESSAEKIARMAPKLLIELADST